MINVFSYDDMKEHITSHGVSSSEFYISILSTGGPYGIPMFDASLPNVITLVFDDVSYDCIKTKLPHSSDLRLAKAMTEPQADDLCNFIKKIPPTSIINVHCAWGFSRSAGIAYAIENKELTTHGNRYVHKLVKERLHEN